MTSSTIRILAVDDEEMILINLVAFLEDEGFFVLSTKSGEEALELLASETVDIAIIDIRLPQMDGDTLIIKAHELQPEMKFLVYTGSVNYTLPKTLMNLGISEEQVFKKPLDDIGVLVQAIHQLIDRKE
jgi:DNA-binding NtrC family response regulator